jgi:hypothetical protein
MSIFDLNKKPDPLKTLLHNYPVLTVSAITQTGDAGKNDAKIYANVSDSSDPNVVFTQSNATSNYKASKLFIYGDLHANNGINFDGELVIKNDPLTNAGSTPSIYMCFVLSANTNNKMTDIDKIIKASGSTPLTVTLNDFINTANDLKYVMYDAKNNNGIPCKVAVFSNPIEINTQLTGFVTACDDLFITPNPVEYSVIENSNQGDWMECDYVPIESADVATYSLPIQSSLIKDSNSMDALRTIIMFVVFFMICVFAYFLIPVIYIAILSKMFKPGVEGEKKKKTVLYLDYVLSFIFGGTGLILICIGAFSDPEKVDNVGNILLAGFAVSIIYIVSYIVIQSKKLSGPFVPGVSYSGASAPEQQQQGE